MSKTLTPLLAIAALAGALTLGACNTVRGAGEDLEQAGDHIQDRADDLSDGDPDTP